jgi:hypothetical protein
MKEQLLNHIDKEIEGLHELDTEGHIWWNRFRNLISEFPNSAKSGEKNIDLAEFKHPLTIEKYSGTLQELAEDIGNLRYDATADFLQHLANKFEKDSKADAQRKRVKLSRYLYRTFFYLKNAAGDVTSAWKICKPKMKL